MGGVYRSIVACARLGNGTGRRTATMAAPLPFTSGLAKYEAGLHSHFYSIYERCQKVKHM